MKSRFLNDLQAGDELLDEPFMLRDMVRRMTKDGRPYLLCTLADKTGQMAGVYWDIPAAIDQWIQSGLVLFITGKVSRYRDSLQIGIVDAYPQEQPNLSDFLPSSPRPQSEMVEELQAFVSELSDPWKTLITKLLLDDQDLLYKYSNSPAAKMMHHACVGGLIEHSLSMARLAVFTADHYPHINKDLLITGALLHDLGKVWEYSFEGSFDQSEDGRLVGHIARAVIVIGDVGRQLEMSEEELREISHLILSHHGTLEWGSPVQPKTVEAVLLHQIDLMDSRLQGFYDHLKQDNGDQPWSSKRSMMHDTHLRRPTGWKV